MAEIIVSDEEEYLDMVACMIAGEGEGELAASSMVSRVNQSDTV